MNLSVEEYIQNYAALAIKEMRTSGIPASIILAQAICESNCGNSSLALETNNHFGIKCKSQWDGMIHVEYDDDHNEDGKRIESCFRKYDSIFDSYTDHTNFLLSSHRYRSLFQLPYYDYKAWAKGLEASNYSSNIEYATLLIRIIENYRLDQFDNPSYSEKSASRPGIAFEKEVGKSN